MKFKFLKTKAILQMFLVVTLSIVFSLELASLNAPAVVAAASEQKVCCEKATDGSFCQYTTKDKCEKGSKNSPTTCDQAAFCKQGCCDMNSANQGCLKGVAKAACEGANGSFSNDISCSMPQCGMGCCVVGTQCVYGTENSCKQLIAPYPALQMDYRAEIQTELECQNICLKQETGCCVSADGCKSLTEGQCDSNNGKFYNSFCSALDKGICDECKKEKKKICVEGADDVYWKDSCGNTEGKAEICDYGKGTLCGFDAETNDYTCKSLDCSSTWNNPIMSKDAKQGGSRKNGESWCEFDADTGPTKDLPGTRHFRHYCYNGKEVVEECKDFREEICLQANMIVSGQTISSAGCRTNRAKDCGACTSEECCKNSDIRDCVWLSPDKKDVDALKKQAEEKSNENITYSVDYKEGNGYCLPMVPLGFKFWKPNGGVQQDSSTAQSGGETMCDYADQNGKSKKEPLKVFWTSWWLQGWDCEKNCIAYTPTFADNMNSMCNAYGDCGAKYNLAADFSNSGFTRKCDLGDNDHGIVGDAANVNDDYLKNSEIGGQYRGSGGAKLLLSQCEDRIVNPRGSNPEDYEQKWAYYLGGLDIKNLGKLNEGMLNIEQWIGMGSAIGGFIAGAITTIALVGWVPLAGWIITAAAVVAAAIMAMINYARRPYEATIPIDCNMWSAPKGGEYCHLCNEPGKRADGVSVDYSANGTHECTEYLCRSLGGACKFVSTDEGSKCISQMCEGANADVSKAVLVPLDGIEKSVKCTANSEDGAEINCDIQKNSNGYEIKPYVKAFTDMTIGVTTCKDAGCSEKDYADCRFDKERKKDIDEMSASFGSSGNDSSGLLGFNHDASLKASVDIEPGGNYSFYVRCQDSCGNGKDMPPYTISFKVASAPDLMPPKLIKINPPSGAFVASDADLKHVELVLNEKVIGGFINTSDANFTPSGCGWSKSDLPYKEMSPMSCAAPVSGDYQRCVINLKNLTSGENTFFFRCKDKSGNENQESLVSDGYKLIKTGPMNITAVKCITLLGDSCGDIYSLNLTLQAFTEGGADFGKAMCGLSTRKVGNSAETDFLFFETNASTHSINLGPLDSRKYEYWIVCDDAAENIAKEFVNFTVVVDKNAPVIQEVHRDGNSIKLRTDEISHCKYQANGTFDFSNAIDFSSTDSLTHSTSIDKGIKGVRVACQDRFENLGQVINVYML